MDYLRDVQLTPIVVQDSALKDTWDSRICHMRHNS